MNGASESELVVALQQWANSLQVTFNGSQRAWSDHASQKRGGFRDEEVLVQTIAFPAFARRFLGWSVGTDLAAETAGDNGRPDFTPADRVSHRFVFETKGTDRQDDLDAFRDQVERYLSSSHINRVVVTNMIAVRVFGLDDNGHLFQDYGFSLRGLWSTSLEGALRLPDAQRFARFVREFSRRQLTTDEKIERMRSAEPWSTDEHTEPDWLRARIAHVVNVFKQDVEARVAEGALEDAGSLLSHERTAIAHEIRGLLVRFGLSLEDAESLELGDILNSNTPVHVSARDQYIAHVAYWLTIKLVLVRVWEDLGLVVPARLYDGGFDVAMSRFDAQVPEVIEDAFRAASSRYRALFAAQDSYSWYRPSRTAAVDGLYELANTYLGEINSDVLGEVYETMLQRIDRKLLGQYYTPRDVIRLMWDLVDRDSLREDTEDAGDGCRVLDIATGSGGFLVEGVVRDRTRMLSHLRAGSSLDVQSWINRVAMNYNGVEFQRFSAFLAELNLLIQLSQVLASGESLRIPELGILNADTLTLHNPHLGSDSVTDQIVGVPIRPQSSQLAARIADPAGADFWFDIAIGNPPYIGSSAGAAALLARLEENHPYWTQFRAAHRDYLYGFLILGVSKLRPGGRFAFITTEYWLRATGAAPLRKYLAENCDFDRLLLFRGLNLFPDAPGQDNLIVIGTRATSDSKSALKPEGKRPLVSVYEGPNTDVKQRPAILDAMYQGANRAGVRSFRSAVAPQSLGSEPWIEVTLSSAQAQRRDRVRSRDQLAPVKTTEGVISTAQAVNNKILRFMTSEAKAHRPKGSGIFVLAPDEFDALGPLNEAELSLVRPAINTADVLPYAVVLPVRPQRLLYLRVPTSLSRSATRSEVVGTALPQGLTAIEAHLIPFRSALTEMMISERDNRYRRPWWTLHDDRSAALDVDDSQRWASYCVMSRWGGGGRLIVGLAPALSVPKSGLHMIYADSEAPGRHAALIAGIYNSDLVQQLADTFAPGQTRGGEIEAIGLPDLGPDSISLIEGEAVALADLVSNAANPNGVAGVYLDLTEVLRSDTSLRAVPRAWRPRPGPDSLSGTVGRVLWLEQVHTSGPQAKKVSTFEFDTTLEGDILRLLHRSSSTSSSVDYRISPDGSLSERHVDALSAWVQGLIYQGLDLRDIASVLVPTSLNRLVDLYLEAKSSLDAFVASYRSSRAKIESEIS